MRSPVLIRRVRGVSMAPTLVDGDFVIGWRFGGFSGRPKTGDVVLLEPASDANARSPVWRSLRAQSMIKRIVTVTLDGYRIDGDASSSLDAESFGCITRADIVARIWLRIPKSGSLVVVRRRSSVIPEPQSSERKFAGKFKATLNRSAGSTLRNFAPRKRPAGGGSAGHGR